MTPSIFFSTSMNFDMRIVNCSSRLRQPEDLVQRHESAPRHKGIKDGAQYAGPSLGESSFGNLGPNLTHRGDDLAAEEQQTRMITRRTTPPARMACQSIPDSHSRPIDAKPPPAASFVHQLDFSLIFRSTFSGQRPQADEINILACILPVGERFVISAPLSAPSVKPIRSSRRR